MVSSEQFHEEPVRERTRLKLRILEWFIKPWYAKSSAYADKSGQRQIWFVDLFAGQGQLSDGTPGSSLIASASDLNELNRTSAADLCIFACEDDSEAYSRLVGELDVYTDQGVYVEHRQGRWFDHARAIGDAIAGKPALLFVDPFGFKDIRMNELLHVASRASAVDVLVKLEDQYLSLVASESPDALDLAVGNDSWRNAFPWDGTAKEKADAFAVVFQRRLSDGLSTNLRKGRSRHFQLEGRSRRRTVSFTMAMASRSMEALRLFMDDVAKAVKARSLDSDSGEQINLLDRQTDSDRRFGELKERIVTFLENRKLGISANAPATYNDILDHVVMTCPFVFEIKEVTSALKSLHEDDRRIKKSGNSPRGYRNDSFHV